MTNKKNEESFYSVVFAGPNGSGKTSLIDAVKLSGFHTLGGHYQMPAHFINPDQVSRDLTGSFKDQSERDRAAFDAGIKMRDEAIAGKQTFAYETVLSHPSRVNEMLRLKEQGYTVLLAFITTDSPEKNVARVIERVRTETTTGHNVLPQTVRERYQRTMQLLPKASEVADKVFVFDNSVNFKDPTMQAIIEKNERFAIADGAKLWVDKYLVTPLQQRETELEKIAAILNSQGLIGKAADELRGQYSGPVMYTSKYFMVQFDDATKTPVIHDRLMLDTAPESHKDVLRTYPQESQVRIQYSQANAPAVDVDRSSKTPEKAQIDRLEISSSKDRGPER